METREMENFYNAPYLNEITVKTLLDQAKNEGIFVTANMNTEASTERSFYEEALEIVNKRKMEFELAQANREREEQMVPNVDEESPEQQQQPSRDDVYKAKVNSSRFDEFQDDLAGDEDSNPFTSNNRVNSAKLESSNKFDELFYDANEEFDEEKSSLTKLPRLFTKTGSDELANENAMVNDEGRLSSMSNSSTTVLPKINERYLPK